MSDKKFELVRSFRLRDRSVLSVAGGRFQVGDHVRWRVPACGPPNATLGDLEGTVVYSGIEIGLKPFDMEYAVDLLSREDFTEEDLEDMRRYGVIDGVQHEDCALVRTAPRVEVQMTRYQAVVLQTFLARPQNQGALQREFDTIKRELRRAVGVQLGDKVRMPASFPEFALPGHVALVIDRDNADWVLELNCDPDPDEYGENVMLWPCQDQDLLEVVL